MSDGLFDHFCSVMNELSLRPGQQIVIALGGGADSQTVLDCAMRFRQNHTDLRYLAVHLDHSFHVNSAAWSDTIEQAVKKYGIDTYFAPLEVSVGPRQSKEAVGRERRYQRLRELSDEDAVILLGQHRNDQIETFLLQLNRGSGPKGLASMAEVHDWYGQRRLVRPLLSVSKAAIYDYAHQHQLTWIEDDTNYDTRIERNFLRHKVVPVLEQRWPQFGASVMRSARLCAEQQQVVDKLLDEKLVAQLIEHPLMGKGLPADTLRHCDDTMQRALLRRWLELAGAEAMSLPSYQQLEQIRSQAGDARADSRMCVQCTGYQVRVYQMALWFVADNLSVESPIAEAVEITEAGTVWLDSPWGSLTVPQALVETHQLSLAYGLEPGKWYHARRKGGKTMTDWLKQAQIPPWLRRSAPRLMCDQKWVWLPATGWLAANPTSDLPTLTQLSEPQWSGATD